MKLRFLALILIPVLFILSCPQGEDKKETVFSKSWSLSGTVKFAVDSTGTNKIKMAAYYTGSSSTTVTTSSTKVSNTVILGDVSSDAKDFSLNIDVSAQSPSDTYKIVLLIWEDEDDNGNWNGTEEKDNLYPTQATGGCPCFGEYSKLNSCNYYYEADVDGNFLMETEYGWNQSLDAAKFKSIAKSVKTGAKLEYVPVKTGDGL